MKYKHSQETRNKISRSLKGRSVWNKGKKGVQVISLETRLKMSKSHIGKKGFKFSDKSKKKMSLSHLGKYPSKEHLHKLSIAHLKFYNNPENRKRWSNMSLGRKHTIESRKKMSEAQKGSKCYAWKGGITPINFAIRNSIQYRLWRESVFARDNWICQRCKKNGGIVAHHIKPFSSYSELRFAIDNGIVFCKSCHNLFHSIYGKKDNNKEQIEEFIDTLV
jgi:hypothetical protein